MPSGCIDIRIGKLEYETSVQFLYSNAWWKIRGVYL